MGREEGEERNGERERKKYIEMKLFSYNTLAHHLNHIFHMGPKIDPRIWF
jgi:hypothetical protein